MTGGMCPCVKCLGETCPGGGGGGGPVTVSLVGLLTGAPNFACRFKKIIMSPVTISVNFKIALHRMSTLRKGPCRVTNFISHVTRLHVVCRLQERLMSPCRI